MTHPLPHSRVPTHANTPAGAIRPPRPPASAGVTLLRDP